MESSAIDEPFRRWAKLESEAFGQISRYEIKDLEKIAKLRQAHTSGETVECARLDEISRKASKQLYESLKRKFEVSC